VNKEASDTKRNHGRAGVLLLVLVLVSGVAFFVRFARATKAVYTPSEKSKLAAWLSTQRDDAAWIDPVRDHIVGQGVLFQGGVETRMYKIHGLKPSEVLARVMPPFKKAGFVVENLTGIAHVDESRERLHVSFMPNTVDYGPIDVFQADGSKDIYIQEPVEFPAAKMAKIKAELGFDPNRPDGKLTDQMLSPS
jgi:hypothetical protein